MADGLRSQGHSRGGGQLAKKKGREAVLVVRQAILDAARGALDPDDVFVKAGAQGGVDLHLSPKAAGWIPYSIEVKGSESLNIWAALTQAADNATPERPGLLFFKRAGTALYAALPAAVFLAGLPWPNAQPSISPTPMPVSKPAPTS